MYTNFPLYPTAIFTVTDYPVQTDNTDTVYADLINALRAEIQACFDELGTLPKGSHSDIKARFDAIEAQLKLELDYMQYATDSAARLAYVSSDGVGSETKDQECAGGSSNEYFGHSTRGKFIYQSFVAGATGKLTKFSTSLKIGAGSPDGVLTGYLYSNNAGVPGDLISTLSSFNASTLTSSWVTYDFTKALDDASYIISGTTYHIVIGYSKIDDSNYIHVAVGGSYASGNHGYGELASWTPQANDQNFAIYYTPYNLDVSSNSVIGIYGDYCVKVDGVITASLNDTLTKTISPVKDLTGKTKITLWVRSNRTGENLKIEYNDTGGEIISHTIEILIVDTWEKKEIDISAVDDNDKNSIDEIKYTVVNANATTIYYLNNNFST